MGLFLVVSGVILSLVWLVLSIVPALLQGTAPSVVASYTTFITGVMDDGIVAPVPIVAGALLLRRAPTGYLLAPMMLVFTVTLGTNLLAAGIAQLLTGVISIGQFIGFTIPFAILTLITIWLMVVLFRNFSESPTHESATFRAAHA